ncbi:hypothetical protein [Paraglaciecola aestuariivivens]
MTNSTLIQTKQAYINLMSQGSFAAVQSYLTALKTGKLQAGVRLQQRLNQIDLSTLSPIGFVEALLNSKKPQIFAESSVKGDGSDWQPIELSILGNISMATQVAVYDNGLHSTPKLHARPFQALLIYTPGALLRNDMGFIPADWNQVVSQNQLSLTALYNLYENRLLPCLRYANDMAVAQGQHTLVTIPGIGCGQFAGKFKGQLGAALEQVLIQLITKHLKDLPAIKAIYYDPFDECENKRQQIEHLTFMVRPLLKGNHTKGQLCHPVEYEEIKGEFSTCSLTSLVAWDQVSWPGNDFYLGSRATDDGVKAAATSTMLAMTGQKGQYIANSYRYAPPAGFANWQEVIKDQAIKLKCTDNFVLY